MRTVLLVQTDKRYQLADWRIRPLPEEMLLYARMDTHYLLYMYDLLKVDCSLLPHSPLPPNLADVCFNFGSWKGLARVCPLRLIHPFNRIPLHRSFGRDMVRRVEGGGQRHCAALICLLFIAIYPPPPPPPPPTGAPLLPTKFSGYPEVYLIKPPITQGSAVRNFPDHFI